MSGQPLDVSRETLDGLKTYVALLEKWNPRINLVSKATLETAWTRHIVDSAQLYELAKHPVRHWVDLGSGGGFPGLVIALMAREKQSPTHVTLVESDMRKCAFLRTVIRETSAPATVFSHRIEELSPLGADVISARALADLSMLFGYTERHLLPDGQAIFPKGASWKKEVDQAQQSWKFSYRVDKSKTEDGSVVLTVSGVNRV